MKTLLKAINDSIVIKKRLINQQKKIALIISELYECLKNKKT